MSLGEEDNTTWASRTLQTNCFSGCESRSLVGWTSTTTRWTLTPVSSKLAAVSSVDYDLIIEVSPKIMTRWRLSLATLTTFTTRRDRGVSNTSYRSRICPRSMAPSTSRQVRSDCILMDLEWNIHISGSYAACGFQTRIQRKQMQFVVQVRFSFIDI